MIHIRPRKYYTSQLPATPCTTDMRKKMESVALSKGVSLAEIQRVAIDIFLSQLATENSKVLDNNSKD